VVLGGVVVAGGRATWVGAGGDLVGVGARAQLVGAED